MIKVRQTRFTAETGNCFSACIASLLEVPIEDVDFTATKPDWMKDEMQPVLDKVGYIYFEIEYAKLQGMHFLPEGFLFIASGRSPRFNQCDHTVIMQIEYKNKDNYAEGYNFILVHDPFPGEEA